MWRSAKPGNASQVLEFGKGRTSAGVSPRNSKAFGKPLLWANSCGGHTDRNLVLEVLRTRLCRGKRDRQAQGTGEKTHPVPKMTSNLLPRLHVSPPALDPTGNSDDLSVSAQMPLPPSRSRFMLSDGAS